METKPADTHARSYEDFDPVCKWRREDARDTLEVHLPGFKRENVKVRVNHLGFIVISGERPIEGNRWKRFNLEIEPPLYCNVNAIHATFVQSIVSVVMPKHIPLSSQKEQDTQIPELKRHQEQKSEREKGKNMELKGHQQEKSEKEKDQSMELRGRGSTPRTKPTDKTEALREDTISKGEEFEEDNLRLAPEATKDVAFKFLVLVIMILVIGSYVTDVFKSMMGHSHYSN